MAVGLNQRYSLRFESTLRRYRLEVSMLCVVVKVVCVCVLCICVVVYNCIYMEYNLKLV